MSDYQRMRISGQGDASKAPVVDFSRSRNVVQHMLDRRRANEATISLLQQLEADCLRDGERMSQDAKMYAGIAAGWAVVLALSDTSRTLLSLRFRSADKAFGEIDTTVSKLDRLLSANGHARLKKEDLVKNLGKEYEKPIKLIEDVTAAREFLKKMGAKETRETRVILDGVIAVSEDVMLFNNAINVGENVSRNVNRQTITTVLMLRAKIQNYKNENVKLNNVIMYEFEKMVALLRTA